MRQAELCDWALDPALFTSLCDSLNRFFTQRGMITSGSNSPLALGATHSLQVPPFTPNAPPTLASLTHPSPLSYAPIAPSSSGAQLPRRPVHMQGHRPPQAHPGKTSTPNFFIQWLSATHRNCKQSFTFNCHAPTTMSSCFSTSAGMPPQSMAPRQRPPLKNLHSNSEEIQDDFDWDSLLI